MERPNLKKKKKSLHKKPGRAGEVAQVRTGKYKEPNSPISHTAGGLGSSEGGTHFPYKLTDDKCLVMEIFA